MEEGVWRAGGAGAAGAESASGCKPAAETVAASEEAKAAQAAVERAETAPVTRANERWAMDFMHDSLANGQTMRVFTAVDVHARECVALRAGKGFRGEDVAAILSEAGAERAALPAVISVDQGTEFTSKSLDHWAY